MNRDAARAKPAGVRGMIIPAMGPDGLVSLLPGVEAADRVKRPWA
jgi:hypothetical protein